MSLQELKGDLEVLKKDLNEFVRTKGGNITFEGAGLCANFFIPPRLAKSFLSWPHYSGDRHYPVPCSEQNSGDGYFWYMIWNTLYVGEQLKLRIDLAKHILKYIEDNDL